MTRATRTTPALADYTTLGLGGRAKSLVTAEAEKDLIEAVRAADAGADPLLLIGGGSNLVISDEGFPGTVIHVEHPRHRLHRRRRRRRASR